MLWLIFGGIGVLGIVAALGVWTVDALRVEVGEERVEVGEEQDEVTDGPAPDGERETVRALTRKRKPRRAAHY